MNSCLFFPDEQEDRRTALTSQLCAYLCTWRKDCNLLWSEYDVYQSVRLLVRLAAHLAVFPGAADRS